MAGGIFPNYPFMMNPKCVIFSAIIIWLYFSQPPPMSLPWKVFVSFIIFIIAYVAMAWYDYKFECQKLALKRGTSKYGITQYLKPPTHEASQTDPSKVTEDEKRFEGILINIYHILIVTPLLLYIGTMQSKASETSLVLLISNVGFAMLYHIPRLLREFNGISLGHILFGAILIYYTFNKSKSALYYNSLIFLSAYAGIKHGYNIIQASHIS
jgi:hypothetical protein